MKLFTPNDAFLTVRWSVADSWAKNLMSLSSRMSFWSL